VYAAKKTRGREDAAPRHLALSRTRNCGAPCRLIGVFGRRASVP
jgi:hypothetical protein